LDEPGPYYADAVEVARGNHEGIEWRLWATRRDDGKLDVEIAQSYWLGPVPKSSGGGTYGEPAPIVAASSSAREPLRVHFGAVTSQVGRVRAEFAGGSRVLDLLPKSEFSSRYFVAFLEEKVQAYVALDDAGREVGRYEVGKRPPA
jgi:hypothetical protein